MKTIKDYISLIRKMPPSVNLAWLLMHVGLGIMVVGMIGDRWLVIAIGVAVIAAAGGLTFILDGDLAVRFSTAVIMTTAMAFMLVVVIVLPICLLAVLGFMVFDGFSWRGVANLLSFLLVMFTFLVVTGIPTLANREPGEISSDVEPLTE